MRCAAMLIGALVVWPQAAIGQQAVVLDRYMSPAAGTTDLLTVQHEVATLEDRAMPLEFGDGRRWPSRFASIGYRAGKLIGFDVPQDHMLLVLGHEVFGHGARLRELGSGSIGYSFEVPIPYGNGGAVTSFSGEFPTTPLAMLAIEMAGIEAQNTMADSIAAAALARGRIHYREAWLYFESRYLALTYVLNATARSGRGNDVADFVRTFRKACVPPECTPVTLDDLKRGARLALADPLLYLSVYGFAGSYVWRGNALSAMPMIPIGYGIRYLPSLGFQMTPYGTEHILRNMFVSGAQRANVTTVTLRVGTTGASTPWAIDWRAADVRVSRRLHVGAAAGIWRQPPLDSDRTSAPLKTGALAAATVVLPLRRLTHKDWLSATVTGGYKSAGFVPGEQLGGGIIFRAGAMLDFGGY